MILIALLSTPGLAAGERADTPQPQRPPPGSNEMLRAPISAADGLEVITSDVVIPPRAEHAPRGGPQGARAVVFRVQVAGQPERIPVAE